MCFHETLFLAIRIALVLYKEVGPLRKSSNSLRRRRQMISLLADDTDQYSASTEDFEIMVCFLHFHEIEEVPRNIHHLVVDLRVS